MKSITRGGRFIREFHKGIRFLGILGTLVLSAHDSHAGSNFFEAVGISTLVGSVMGASTLPFYEQPGDHVANIGIGALIGAGVGLGIWGIGLLGGSDGDSANASVKKFWNAKSAPMNGSTPYAYNMPNTRSPKLTIPLVSLHW